MVAVVEWFGLQCICLGMEIRCWEDTMDGLQYLKILLGNTHPFVVPLRRGKEWVFQRDKAYSARCEEMALVPQQLHLSPMNLEKNKKILHSDKEK
ncbi:hypothetical protein TNIN_498921 [Trichonephila inaurata madagascariensis]|uniref:Uncharacterized protein n=1 Tax=Trichonephila inaurata madagascariensis TaxID=2747483 RepID=A0A8X6WRC4_9ARAC|nr:hypothetical protein TNIN_498921 [Trichonephila inaurata madagascariensis]